MRTLLGYIMTPIFHLSFALILLFFHPIQYIAHRVFGEKARVKVVNGLIFFLVHSLHIMGCRISYKGYKDIPKDRPVIVVSNHQSLYDISAINYRFKSLIPKFISKVELGKKIPSVSYNLVHGKSALIDRSKGAQSVKEIFKLGRLIEQGNFAACIFPEGTRSRNGQLKKFQSAGINTLLRASPSAVIIPFVIDGHSQLINDGKYPYRFGQRITYTVLEPIEPKEIPIEELTLRIENAIKKQLNQG